ncbi:hypothetical protein L0Z72_15205 [candidate division KSB1 bacterium]|nr:hypothetical protein [candidate division KSB1 bacterium]
MKERGATDDEVKITVESGELFPAKFGRTGFRRNLSFFSEWRGVFYNTKQVEVYAIKEQNDWLVITVITKYF